MRSSAEMFAWTPWIPLRTSPTDPVIPHSPGLYRIRRIGRTGLDYIGQTGMRLGQRLAMLRGVYVDEMPYRDPHTAAPALWALRHATGCDFECIGNACGWFCAVAQGTRDIGDQSLQAGTRGFADSRVRSRTGGLSCIICEQFALGQGG